MFSMRLFPVRILTILAVLILVFTIILLCCNDSPSDNTNVIKVVILSSNPRSGSTYLAELISQADIKANYWYEPLRWIKEAPSLNQQQMQFARVHQISAGILHDDDKETWTDKKLRLLQDFMDCKFRPYSGMILSDNSRAITFRKPKPALGVETLTPQKFLKGKIMAELEKNCLKSNLRVLKTIRLTFEELLLDRRWDSYKVVLLLRDPRAVLNSVLERPEADWEPEYSSPPSVCWKALLDLETYARVQETRKNVLLVQYEHLIDNKEEEVKRIFNFLGLNDEQVITQNEWWDELITVKGAASTAAWKKYFGTRRGYDFRHDRWKETIPADILKQAQKDENCRRVLDILGYD